MSGLLTFIISSLSRYWKLLHSTASVVMRSGVRWRDVSYHVVKIGFESLPIVFITGLFTGMVLALQTAYGLERFGAKNYVGNITGLGFLRELGPVLTAIVVCGRVGAGISAELASMKVTEQLDAMEALGADPYQRLIAPRIFAAVIACPLLVVFADLVGIYGGLMVAVYELGISAHLYTDSLVHTVIMRDFTDGVVKGAVFGFLVVSIACYKGIFAREGTVGVGAATTSAVVTGSITIFISDFFITKFLLLF